MSVCTMSLITKLVDRRAQGLLHGIRRGCTSVGIVIGPLWGGGFVFEPPLFILPLAFVLIYTVSSFERESTSAPKIWINTSPYIFPSRLIISFLVSNSLQRDVVRIRYARCRSLEAAKNAAVKVEGIFPSKLGPHEEVETNSFRKHCKRLLHA